MDLSILGLSSLGNDEHFVQLGETSLQASLLNGHIRRSLDADISRWTLYDHPTVAELAAIIIEKFRGCSSETIRNEQEEWIEDTKIANGLLLPSVPVVDWRRDTEGRNFLTGATGLLEPFCWLAYFECERSTRWAAWCVLQCPRLVSSA